MTARNAHAKLVSMENAQLLQTDSLRRLALSAREHLGPVLFGPARPRPRPPGWRGWLMTASALGGVALILPAIAHLAFDSWPLDWGQEKFVAAFFGLALLAVRYPLWTWRASLVATVLTRVLVENPRAATFEFLLTLGIYWLASIGMPRTTARWMAALTVLIGAADFSFGYGQRFWAVTTVGVVAVVTIDAMRDWQADA